MMMPGPGGPGAPPAGSSGTASASAAGGTTDPAQKSLWYLGDDGKLAVLRVSVGVSDGTNTELIEADGLAGRKIILKAKVE
jgi:hypothetical protein